jgi:hypothetical protein
VSSQRILLTGGLLLFILSAGYGLVFDGFVMVQAHQSLVYNLDMALNMAAKGDVTMAGAFAEQFASESFAREAGARISLHLALAGAMTTAPLWIAAKLDVSERMKRIMALMIVGGGMLLALGDFVQAGVAQAAAGRYLALVGYAWMLLGLAGYLLYTVLHIWLYEEERRPKRG